MKEFGKIVLTKLAIFADLERFVGRHCGAGRFCRSAKTFLQCANT